MNLFRLFQIVIMSAMLLLMYNVIFISIFYKKAKDVINIYSNIRVFMFAHMLMILLFTYFASKYIQSNANDQFYYYVLFFTLLIFVLELMLYPIFVYKFYYIKDNKIYQKKLNKIKEINPKQIASWTGYYDKKHVIIYLKDNTSLTFEKGLINIASLVKLLEDKKIKRIDKKI